VWGLSTEDRTLVCQDASSFDGDSDSRLVAKEGALGRARVFIRSELLR
jgi:hypothetical protein